MAYYIDHNSKFIGVEDTNKINADPNKTLVPLANVSTAQAIEQRHRKIDSGNIVEMTDAEKLAVDKPLKLAALKAAITAYIYANYDQETQSSFAVMYARAIALGLTNRAAHIAAAIDWYQDAVLVDFYARYGAASAATTLAALNAVSTDFSNNDATNPGATISTAKAIAD